MIAEYISEIDTYKAQADQYKAEADESKTLADKYKAEAEKYKTLATKNGINATNVNLSVSQVKVSGKPAAKLNWSKTGSYSIAKYQVYRSTKADSGFKLLTTVKSSVKTYKDTTVKKGKTYYYKVRAYKTVDGNKVYTQWSPVISLKIS